MQAQKNEILQKMHEMHKKRRRQLCVAQIVWAEKNKVSKIQMTQEGVLKHLHYNNLVGSAAPANP